MSGANLRAQTLAVHRLPAVLALEAVSEAVTACAKQGYKVSATVIDPEGVRIAMLRGDRAGVPPVRMYLISFSMLYGMPSSGSVT